MTHDEVIDLLSYIAARDNRTVGRATALAWHEDVGDLAYEDCREAVRIHFRESSDWLMPAHIRDLVRRIRDDRLANIDLALPAADPADEQAYREALKNITRRIADGVEPFKAIGGPPAGAPPNDAIRQARDDLAARRMARIQADNLKPDTNGPACQCGVLLDPDGSCFACQGKAGAS